MKVEDAMTSAVHTCSRYRMLDEATRTMWEQDIGALPVVDDHGKPIAMITDRDACMAAYTQGKRLSEIQVQSTMSKLLHTCHRHDQLSAAEHTMRVHQLHRLPVVDDTGTLVGILSLGDIAVARVRSPLTRAAERLMSDVAVTLAAIGRRPAQAPDVTPQDSWNAFEIHDSAAFREATREYEQRRVPPPTLASALSHFRT